MISDWARRRRPRDYKLQLARLACSPEYVTWVWEGAYRGLAIVQTYGHDLDIVQQAAEAAEAARIQEQKYLRFSSEYVIMKTLARVLHKFLEETSISYHYRVEALHHGAWFREYEFDSREIARRFAVTRATELKTTTRITHYKLGTLDFFEYSPKVHKVLALI